MLIEAVKVTHTESLAALTRLKSLSFYVQDQNSFDFLDDLQSEIDGLFIGTDESKNAKADMSPLSHLKQLKILKILRYNKGLAGVIPQLRHLEDLTLTSIAGLNKIDFLARLEPLTKLRLNACGIESYEPLAGMTHLKALGLYKTAKLQTLDILSHMTGLQFVFLQEVNTPAVFPRIDHLPRLRRIVLHSMKSIRDFQALEKASSLKEFCFYNVQTQQPEDFIPVFTNRHIEAIDIWMMKSGYSGYRKKLESLMAQYGRQLKGVNYLSDEDFVYE